MTRQLRALIASLEDPGSISTTHMVAHNHLVPKYTTPSTGFYRYCSLGYIDTYTYT